MDKLAKIIKEYSSKKLKEIIEQQSSSYSQQFIDYTKDELIKRGENFPLNVDSQKEIAEMTDTNLKNLVEYEYYEYHLEFLEIARKEYLRRGFVNKTEPKDEQNNMNELLQKYIGQNIGINFREFTKYEFAKLIKVETDYFTVENTETNISYNYSFNWVLSVIESDGKLSTGFFSRKKFPVCIEVYHLVVYSGATGIGISI
jgi:hypothetical protein